MERHVARLQRPPTPSSSMAAHRASDVCVATRAASASSSTAGEEIGHGGRLQRRNRNRDRNGSVDAAAQLARRGRNAAPAARSGHTTRPPRRVHRIARPHPPTGADAHTPGANNADADSRLTAPEMGLRTDESGRGQGRGLAGEMHADRAGRAARGGIGAAEIGIPSHGARASRARRRRRCRGCRSRRSGRQWRGFGAHPVRQDTRHDPGATDGRWTARTGARRARGATRRALRGSVRTATEARAGERGAAAARRVRRGRSRRAAGGSSSAFARARAAPAYLSAAGATGMRTQTFATRPPPGVEA